MSNRFLRALPVTREAFAPLGWVIDAPDAVGVAINGGSSQRIDGLTELAFDAEGGKPCLAIFKAKARDPAGPWVELERHCLGTQTFIPLNGVPYVVLVALGAAKPDASTLRAFTVSGQQGITLRAGTWHHGLLALSDGDFVVLERSADAVDCELAQLLEPVSIILS
jgi:ureidoglycolate lyase